MFSYVKLVSVDLIQKKVTFKRILFDWLLYIWQVGELKKVSNRKAVKE